MLSWDQFVGSAHGLQSRRKEFAEQFEGFKSGAAHLTDPRTGVDGVVVSDDGDLLRVSYLGRTVVYRFAPYLDGMRWVGCINVYVEIAFPHLGYEPLGAFTFDRFGETNQPWPNDESAGGIAFDSRIGIPTLISHFATLALQLR